MKVLITGGRDFQGRDIVFATLDALHYKQTITLLVHGGARGADALAQAWANARQVASQVFPADWAKHGRAAGPMRNSEMLRVKPDLVVAFPGGRGTADMVRKARRAGFEVFLVNPQQENENGEK